MSCTNTGPFDGGTWIDSIIRTPEISGGTVTGSELSGVSLTGSVKVDDAVAKQLAQFLCEYVKGCVEFPAEDVAAVFKDCAGKAHVPNAQVPTCAEMQEAIAEAVEPVVASESPQVTEATVENDVPTTIVGSFRDQLLGRPAAYLKVGKYLIPAYTAE